MRYRAPNGTFDILPPGPGREWYQDSAKRQWFESSFREQCRLFGYEEIRTPIFEATELFHRAVGEGTDIVSKETYDFVTRGGDKMTLQPEGTAGALRAYVQNRLYIERPVAKLYYLAPIFRYERQQKGRFRQHHQAGIEVLGADGAEVDAEVISLALSFLGKVGIRRFVAKINSVGTVESRANYVKDLRAFAEPLLSEMSEDNQRRFRENALRMLDSKIERDQELLADAPVLLDYLDDESRAHFEALQAHLSALGATYEVDPRLVRGFDYYTRTAFEIQSPDIGAQSTLCGGGRYNRLVEDLGGPPTPGIGFGMGIERLLIALETANVPTPEPPAPVAYLCPLGDAARAACVPLLANLRGAGVAADMEYKARKMGAMLENADRRRARFAVIIGDNELADGVVQVRSMAVDPALSEEEQRARKKEQTAVPLGELAGFLDKV